MATLHRQCRPTCCMLDVVKFVGSMELSMHFFCKVFDLQALITGTWYHVASYC